MRYRGILLVGLLLCCSSLVQAGDTVLQETVWSEIDPEGNLPADLVDPAGKTRWDLRSLPPSPRSTRSVRVSDLDPGVLIYKQGSREFRYTDPAGGTDARQWLMPSSHPAELLETDSHQLWLVEQRDGATDRLVIHLRRAGTGWVFLESGAHEAVLQEALILREAEGSRGFVPDRLVHRWIDPRTGVVAEVAGPAAGDGRTRTSIERVAVSFDEPGPGTNEPLGGSPLRIYLDEEDVGIYNRLLYGFDTGPITIDELAGLPPGTNTTAWDFACNPATPGGNDCQTHAWDFSMVNLTNYPGMAEAASSVVPVEESESCSFTECGFTQATRIGREDRDFDRLYRVCGDGTTACLVDADCAGIGDEACRRGGLCPDDATVCINDAACSGIGTGDCTFGAITVSGNETVEIPGVKGTIYLRGAVRNEAETEGGLGENESRICYYGGGRSEVPLLEYQHPEAGRFYMENGDSWSSDPFDCDLNIFNHVCGNSCGLFCQLYTKSCDGGDYSGKQFIDTINEGTVTLPSGHTFNALVVRNTAEFCVFWGSSCTNLVLASRVRTVIYMWQVPFLGTVARLMSDQNTTEGADPLRDFTSLAETDIKFGLFPPREITVDGTGETSVSISWDPGLDTHRIGSDDGDYRIYWDTESGGGVDETYGFDSITHAGQVTFGGTSATIGGLASNTEYFFTVTTMSGYRYPTNSPQRTYESLRFPTQVSGGADAVPAEVSATTGGACTPTLEVQGVTGAKSGGGVELCWNPAPDPCNEGYALLGADSPEAAGNFTEVVPDTGLVTCHTFDPSESYFLVVGTGTGGTGPWGHFGQ